MSYMSSLFRWLQRKRYQYEVTFSLYMLTPTEKIIFSTFFPSYIIIPLFLLACTNTNPTLTDSFLFLFLSMIIIAASLYLPEHISTIMRRAWFYWAGDETGTLKSGRIVVGDDIVAGGRGFDAGGGGMDNGYGGGDVLERLGSL